MFKHFMIAVGFLILFTLPANRNHSFDFFFSCFFVFVLLRDLYSEWTQLHPVIWFQSILYPALIHSSFLLSLAFHESTNESKQGTFEKEMQEENKMQKEKKDWNTIWFSVLAIEIGQRDHAICLLWIYASDNHLFDKYTPINNDHRDR